VPQPQLAHRHGQRRHEAGHSALLVLTCVLHFENVHLVPLKELAEL
jgi:hypothetical protein